MIYIPFVILLLIVLNKFLDSQPVNENAYETYKNSILYDLLER